MEENFVPNEAAELVRKEYEEKIKAIRLGYLIEIALLKAGARNIKAAAALLEPESISIDENGNVSGLDEQIERLKKDEESAFLFTAPQCVKGLIPYDGTDAHTDDGNMSYSRFCEIYAANNY